MNRQGNTQIISIKANINQEGVNEQTQKVKKRPTDILTSREQINKHR